MELELRPVYSAADRLTVAEILGIIVEQHLAGKAFQRPAKSYMNAWIRTSGRIFFELPGLFPPLSILMQIGTVINFAKE